MADVPWNHPRCIVCLANDRALTLEHVIPDCLGGRLTSVFLCKSCNSTLGHKVEAAAKSDPSIRIAMQRLRDQIPALAARLEDEQAVIAKSSGGTIRGTVRKGEFRAHAHKAPDGSLIQPTDIGRRSLQRILKKHGYDEEPIRTAIATFEITPDNQRIEVAPGVEIVKWSIESLSPDFSKGELLNTLIPVKIAYEFMALHVGSAIYNDTRPLAEIRGVLLSGDSDSSVFEVERLTSDKYEPFHGICFEGNDPHAKVLIRLFGWLSFRVHFLQLAFGGPRFVYTHRLDTNQEHAQAIPTLRKGAGEKR